MSDCFEMDEVFTGVTGWLKEKTASQEELQLRCSLTVACLFAGEDQQNTSNAKFFNPSKDGLRQPKLVKRKVPNPVCGVYVVSLSLSLPVNYVVNV